MLQPRPTLVAHLMADLFVPVEEHVLLRQKVLALIIKYSSYRKLIFDFCRLDLYCNYKYWNVFGNIQSKKYFQTWKKANKKYKNAIGSNLFLTFGPTPDSVSRFSLASLYSILLSTEGYLRYFKQCFGSVRLLTSISEKQGSSFLFYFIGIFLFTLILCSWSTKRYL